MTTTTIEKNGVTYVFSDDKDPPYPYQKQYIGVSFVHPWQPPKEEPRKPEAMRPEDI